MRTNVILGEVVSEIGVAYGELHDAGSDGDMAPGDSAPGDRRPGMKEFMLVTLLAVKEMFDA